VQSSDDVYVSSRGSSAWGAPALLDPQSSQGAHLWAGHDGTGQVQLFYTGAGGPRRIAGAPGAWNLAASTPAVAGNNSYVSVAVAFGPGGVIHAVYGGIGVGVVYAAFDGCAWSTQIVDADTSMGGYPAIALDGSGRPQVAYQAAQLPTTTQPDSDLWYAHPAP